MPALVTRDYLQRRIWLAALTIVVSIAISVFAGWHMLSSFRTHGHYSKLFVDLIEATSRLESEMSSPAANDATDPANKGLEEAVRSVAALYTLIRHIDASGDDGLGGLPEAISPKNGVLERLTEQYRLDSGSMPEGLEEVWETKGAAGFSLETAINELLVQGSKLIAIPDRGSAQYHAIANYVRSKIHAGIWPAFQRGLDAIGKSTANSAQLGFYLLALCGGAVLLVTAFNTLLLFGPMVRSILNNQRQLILERDRALASEKAKRDFLALMGHELRTPMNGVLGFTNMLLSTDLAPKQKEYAETIQSSGLTLLDLLNDILDISHMETGALELEQSHFAINDVIAEVISLLGPPAFAKRLDISALIDPSLPERMTGDVGRLRQILLKLAGNAIKFTERGGIAIEARYAGLREDGQHEVEFTITDTGIGIPDDHLPRIFEHFTQVDSSTQRRYDGVGLGLPICKQLVELMGGEITVESIVDQGSVFRFRIRLGNITPAVGSIRENMDMDLGRRRCLIVDDNALNRRIVRLQLEAFGAEGDGAPDAQTAMAALAEAHRDGRPYRIAIIDHTMPGIDGLVLRRMIREQPQYAGIKLVLSSSGGIAYDQQARALGFDAACPKPVVQEKLVALVHDLLQQQQPAASSPAIAIAPPEPVTAVPAQMPADEGKNRKPRLLVAEDNSINQRLIMTALKQAGYVVDMVGDGVEAVHAVQRLPYDLILMDIRMPVMSGVEATQRIRSMEGKAAQIPIIAMTANTMVGDREEYLESGMNDYVAKPVDFHLLLRKLETYLSDDEDIDEMIPEEPPSRKAPGGANRA